jgi:hypothetical protein
MVDLTKNISNSMTLYGVKPTNKWNVAVWNVNKWGTGDIDLREEVGKFIGETLTLSDSVGKQNVKNIVETLTIVSDATDMYLIDRNGWYRVFPKPTTDSDERTNTVWTEV